MHRCSRESRLPPQALDRSTSRDSLRSSLRCGACRARGTALVALRSLARGDVVGGRPRRSRPVYPPGGGIESWQPSRCPTDVFEPARPARRVPPSASLATDHSGLLAPSGVGRCAAGLKWMWFRRQRFTRSGPADRGFAARDGRGCVAANGECAGRSLGRVGARCWLGPLLRRALARAQGRSRRRKRERADESVGR